MLRIEQWSKQIVPVLLGSTSQWGRHFKKDKEKGREQTCYLGCSGQGRPLCVHGFLHRDLNELRGVSQRGIWRWDLLKWHMLSCRSWPWPPSDVPYASTVPLYSNLTEYLLLFTEFCVSISEFYSSSSQFLLLECSPTQIFWVMSSCDSFLWLEMPLNTHHNQNNFMVSSPAWRAGWAMGPWCELPRVYYCCWSIEVICKSVLASSVSLILLQWRRCLAWIWRSLNLESNTSPHCVRIYGSLIPVSLCPCAGFYVGKGWFMRKQTYS